MSDVPAQRIDDEFEYGNMVRKMLRKMGHPREVAEDAFEALERLADEQFDLVISDVAMLGKDGLELAKEARAKYPDVDFIIMPGHGTALPFISITNARAVDLIGKPFSGEELGTFPNGFNVPFGEKVSCKTNLPVCGKPQLHGGRYFEDALVIDMIG